MNINNKKTKFLTSKWITSLLYIILHPRFLYHQRQSGKVTEDISRVANCLGRWKFCGSMKKFLPA